MAASYPETHEQLRPRVIAYAKPILEGGEGLFVGRLLNLVNGIFLMLLAVVCVNIATLVFARTATCGWEIAVRNALGASRGRIVTQLFLEALVLASVAAVFGLIVAKISMRWRLSLLAGNEMPFWINDSLSWTTMLYTALLTLFGAAVLRAGEAGEFRRIAPPPIRLLTLLADVIWFLLIGRPRAWWQDVRWHEVPTTQLTAHVWAQLGHGYRPFLVVRSASFVRWANLGL